MSNTPQRTTVTDMPRAKVKELADNVRQLLALKDRQAQTQAQLIRWCVYAINQTTAQASATLERERRNHPNLHKRHVRMHEPARKVSEDRKLALLHLEWLATQLEGPVDLAAAPDNLRKSRG